MWSKGLRNSSRGMQKPGTITSITFTAVVENSKRPKVPNPSSWWAPGGRQPIIPKLSKSMFQTPHSCWKGRVVLSVPGKKSSARRTSTLRRCFELDYELSSRLCLYIILMHKKQNFSNTMSLLSLIFFHKIETLNWSQTIANFIAHFLHVLRSLHDPFHWISILLQIFNQGMVKLVGHFWFPIKDPQVLVSWLRDHAIFVVLAESDDPVRRWNPESHREIDLEFGVGVILGDCTALYLVLLATAVAVVPELHQNYTRLWRICQGWGCILPWCWRSPAGRTSELRQSRTRCQRTWWRQLWAPFWEESKER